MLKNYNLWDTNITNVFFSGEILPNFDPKSVPFTCKPKKKAKTRA
jgi:hypothetical protein